MPETFLICIFGDGQPRSYGGRTAEPVCGGESAPLYETVSKLPAFHWSCVSVRVCVCVCVLSQYLNVELGALREVSEVSSPPAVYIK